MMPILPQPTGQRSCVNGTPASDGAGFERAITLGRKSLKIVDLGRLVFGAICAAGSCRAPGAPASSATEPGRALATADAADIRGLGTARLLCVAELPHSRRGHRGRSCRP